ncbi:hypothetical protein [Lentzea jiangxiensis]|uniref:Uncharacterized protein n=1 Tax=Lentzea jiangxiensis TaxID=641025 RepID=A0A1H0PXF8_9PSEU|nr:hypothetical protein [Lentzea jiangxiensis]SDP09802.1 hypothetical protein SAMN05421507_105234 [Lentzea jiangxiensis]
MCNQASGAVHDGGTVLQVHEVGGDIVLHRGPARRARAGRTKVRTARALVLLLLIAAGQYAISALGDGTFPDAATVRPIGADEKEIKTVVDMKLRSCASEHVPIPVNCPQRSTTAPRVHRAKWAIRGFPIDGMRVVWRGTRAFVSGTAIMTINYLTPNGTGDNLDKTRFSAEVRWHEGSLTEEDVDLLPYRDLGPILKRDFELTKAAAKEAIDEAFDLCTRSTTSPMAPICPRAEDTPLLDGVKWELNKSRVFNEAMNNDYEFGLVLVTGSYSVMAWSQDDRLVYTQLGTYRATLVRVANGIARVLQIQHLP